MLEFVRESESRTNSGKKKAFYKCDCGSVDEYIVTVVQTQRKTLCKECSIKEATEKRVKNLMGCKIGRWTVFARAENNPNCRGAVWKCKCDCGNISDIRARDLHKKKSTQCLECHKKETKKRKIESSYFKNGQSATNYRIYRIWKSMKNRCYGSHNTRWYKDEGVYVCDEWKNNFNAFYEWAMSNGYDDTKEIDKDMKCDHFEISPKRYSPDTCIWIDKKVNTRYSTLKDLVMKRELISAYI